MNGSNDGRRASAWERLCELADQDLGEETPAEVARGIREAGGDPEAIAARGKAFAAELLAKRARLGWRAQARARLDSARALADAMPSRRGLPRAELLARIEALRGASRVVVAYRGRKPEEASDDELAALLEELELAAKLDESGGGGGSKP